MSVINSIDSWKKSYFAPSIVKTWKTQKLVLYAVSPTEPSDIMKLPVAHIPLLI